MKNTSLRVLIAILTISLVSACNFSGGSHVGTGQITTSPAIETTLRTPTEAPSPEVTPVMGAPADLDFLAKPNPKSFRVMSYNVNWDAIFPDEDPHNHALRSANRVTSFRKLLAAIQPDIVCLQEINPDRDPRQVSEIIASVLSPDGEEGWSAASVRDNVIAARFAVLTEGFELAAPGYPRDLAQAAALIDLPDDLYGRVDLYMLCAHFKAGGNASDIHLRQTQADAVIQQLGDAITPGGELDLPEGTPMVVLGDFNVYDTDPAHHLTTLLSGDIEDEERYGPDTAPDWDGTALADALPSHNGQGETFYTWRDDTQPFNPGILDRILFTDSVLMMPNAFVLDAGLLPESAQQALNLSAEDLWIDYASGELDHLPLVADFAIAEAP